VSQQSLARPEGVVNPVKLFFWSDHHANMVTVSHPVFAHVGGPKNFGMLGPRPMGLGVAAAQ